jgi:MerR family mercuric resistance operon transcriptional regulator
MSAPAPLRIGQVSRKTGLSIDTIRFYEKEGLLYPPVRTTGGYRLYSTTEVADLEFIQRAQGLGFSLSEIRGLFSIQRHSHEVCEHVRDLIAQKLAVVRGKITELQRLETASSDALAQCRKALRKRSKHPVPCPVLHDMKSGRPRGG